MIYDEIFNEFDDYLDIELSDTIVSNIEQNVIDNGIEQFVENQFRYLDCTRWDKEHKHRLMQTVGAPYKIEMAKLICGVTNFIPDEAPQIAERLHNLHLDNLEYEKTYPPEIYKKTKSSSSGGRGSTKEKVKREPKPKKTKEQKFKERIQGLNFNIKI